MRECVDVVELPHSVAAGHDVERAVLKIGLDEVTEDRHWTTMLGGQPPVTNRTQRTRLIALAAVFVNRSGRPTLRFPARWPWATQFTQTLNALRSLPAPSG